MGILRFFVVNKRKMRNTSVVLAALLANAINQVMAAPVPIMSDASSDLSKQEYKDFADDMDYWGFTWEPIKVKTDDGWTLTTFRITGKKGETEPKARDDSLNPVLMMHG